MAKRIDLGKFESAKNGKILKYRIQTVTPELIDDVVDLMFTHFLPREPLSSYLGVHKDAKTLDHIDLVWRKLLEDGVALVALEDVDNGNVKIIGANIVTISEKDKEDLEELEDRNFNKILIVLKEVTNRANIFEKYNIDRYLSAFGLTVHADYHGHQIGYRLLAARRDLCAKLGLTVTGTAFTAQNSQHLAKKAGFETLAEIVYKNYKINDELAFPNLEGDVK
uniref:N-acetyltransferase domain-containing protein n=3 Tax=Rhodnius TaxID=13248 RepID=T1HX63_RHOPR